MHVLGPAVAGSWYPRERDRLRAAVSGYLDAAPSSSGDAPIALIAPHAGYAYSGRVAGAAFASHRQARQRQVLLLGPSHHFAFRGLALPEADVYRTPLGDAPIDLDAIARLAAGRNVRVTDRYFEPEHALEAEIPFLQSTLTPGFRLVPCLVGDVASGSESEDLAGAIAPALTKDTLIVVSSDFVHFGPRFGFVPFDREVEEGIRRLDHDALGRIEAGDPDGFATLVEETGATICGRRAIELALRLLGSGSRGRLLAYDTSGRITGDWTHSVSYAAVALGVAPKG